MKRLLVVKLSSIGDVLHALPVVKSIKRDLPDLFIGWVVRERCAGLLAGCEFVDRVFVVRDKPRLTELLRLRKELREASFDTAFDMQGLLLSGVITWLSGAPRRVGLDRNREMNTLFMTEPNVLGRVPLTHAVDVQLGFRHFADLGAISSLPPISHLGHESALWLTSYEHEFGKAKVAALNVGASTIYKKWPNDRWISLANRLSTMGWHIVLTAGPTETADSDEIADGIEIKDLLTNLGGKTNADQLAAILKRSDLVVSGDTGPMHLAAAMGTSTIALFGPTDPRLTGPYGKNHRTIWKELSCSPCFRHPTCNGRVDCLKAITVDEVLVAATELKRELTRSAIA